jgi:hypothetical protein
MLCHEGNLGLIASVGHYHIVHTDNELFFFATLCHFFFTVFHFFTRTPSFFNIFSPPAPISMLKQPNPTVMLSDGLCGFRVKNAHRKKNQWIKKRGCGKKGGGVAKKWKTVAKK